MSCPNDDILSYFLPDVFKYKVLECKLFDDQNFECHVRIALRDINEFRQWLKDFEEKTNTSWIVKRSLVCDNKTSYVVNRNYVCQHSSFRKKRKSVGTTKKDKSCEAAFTVRIKRNNACIRYHDRHVKEGLTAVVKISFVHSHYINDTESRNWLRRSQETCDTFTKYFEKGMTPIEAIKCHQDSLMCDPDKLSNSRKNPPRSWVYALHEKWIEKESTKVPSDSTNSIMITRNISKKPHNSHTTFESISASEPNHGEQNCTEPFIVNYEFPENNFASEVNAKYIFQEQFTNSKEKVLEKWDNEMSRLRDILKDNIADGYFRSRIDTFLNISSSVWTKDQMCTLLEMGTI